jgi:hypothetical protein
MRDLSHCLSPHRCCGITDHDFTAPDVSQNHSASTDHGIRADLDALNDCGVRANHHAVAYLNVTTDRRTRHNAGAFSDQRVVAHEATMRNIGVVHDLRARGNRGLPKYDATRANFSARSNIRHRMDDSSVLREIIGETSANGRPAKSKYKARIDMTRLSDVAQIGDVTRQPRLPISIGISDYFCCEVGSFKGRKNIACMSAAADKYNMSLEHGRKLNSAHCLRKLLHRRAKRRFGIPCISLAQGAEAS